MIDKKLIDYVDKCNERSINSMNEALDTRFKSLTSLIAIDNQNIKDKIKEVKDHVEKQNGSIRSLNEWRAGVEGGRTKIKNMTPWIAVVIAALTLAFSMYNNNRVNRIKEEQAYTEWKMEFKKDKDPSDISSIIRSADSIKELKDSI